MQINPKKFPARKPILGFTLVETLVGVAVFLVISTATYQAYISLFSLINLNQYKILALNLANEQFEIIRNLTYADVGIQGGIPSGKVPHTQSLTRGGVAFIVTTTIRNVDLPFDGTIDGTPDDLSPADNKSVEVQIDCPTCKNFTAITLTTTVAPKNLETASTNGALIIKVFDANGVAVSGANVHVLNSQANPDIVIDDITDVNGTLQIVDAPPGIEAYEITVSKSGYSTDRTYLTGGAGNPSPSKPHSTVVLQQVTQISFSIDRLSSVSFSSVSPTCVMIPSLNFSLTGSKQIGQNVSKFSQNLSTDALGSYSNNAIEWDAYTAVGIDADYDIIGINPLNPIGINPNSNQNVSLIALPKDPKSLLVTVKDSATLLPITGATVVLTGSSYSESQITDRGFINQTDWSDNQYTMEDGNIDVSNPEGELKLKQAFGEYNPNGLIESSTFDTGSASNFYNLVWSPSDQPVQSGANSVRFQIATSLTNTATTTWTYLGPDGTSGTYYTSSNSPIASIHNDRRYLRYKIWFATESATSTPNISDVAFTFTSSCTPPGQVVFSNLSSGNYHISVSKSGYSTTEADVSVSSAWKEQEIILSP